jgi:ATP-dependent helicase HrpA
MNANKATKKYFKEIERLLPKALLVDRIAVRRHLGRLRRNHHLHSEPDKIVAKLAKLEEQTRASADLRRTKIQNSPRLTYNPELPIVEKKAAIIDAIMTHPVVIVSGETGSGKTTQLPKFCIEAGRGIDGRIGCTQPRRIAATTVANRIAEEMGETLGRSVGYKIRFKEISGRAVLIQIMTDGILLAETQSDGYLNEYDTIIVDEAHERSLNVDFILGYLKNLLRRRRDLKLIITSATIDTQKFSRAFDNAPVIEVSGRMFPVETRYFPLESETDVDQGYVEAAVRAVDRLQQKSPHGDILIFMPTEQDIRETCDLIEGRHHPGMQVMPLFARLSGKEQKRVFSRPKGRKVIVATNVAETSITIPGIRYVVDTGLARISQYTPRSRTTSLPVTAISRSSADQRMGRCGRMENGVCIRLFSQEDYESRPLFTQPEILRSNLAEVILRMIALRLGDIDRFDFIDRPVSGSIQDGFKLLAELGAIAAPRKAKESSKKRVASKSKRARPYRLTASGRMMARLPVDPRLARMLIEAAQQGCLKEAAVLVSALSIQDPKERPLERQAQADQAHARFKDCDSDFVVLLNIWEAYQQVASGAKTWKAVKRFCRDNYLSFKRMREWRDIHTQIKINLEENGLWAKARKRPPEPPPKTKSLFDVRYTAIHRSILSGFLSNIAVKKEKQFFRATKERQVMVFPGSYLFNNPGTWIVAAEMVETSRLFARTVANIDNAWLEELGGEQCKFTYTHPHWERNRGQVMATLSISLYGLIIEPGRPAVYGPVAPREAADIFIQSALVEGDLKQPFAFMVHNKALIDEIQGLEDRVRRRDILIHSQEIFCFYQSRLKGIYDLAGLKSKIRRKGGDDFLILARKDLIRHAPKDDELACYPEKICIGQASYGLDYRFDPGVEEDGVTVTIPSSKTSAVPGESLEWLVPGLLQDKITALIKGLPKEYRKRLVPVGSTVARIMEEMAPKDAQGSLKTALSRFIHHRFGVDIPATAWSEENLPDHLRMRIAVTTPDGKIVRSGRDAARLLTAVPCDKGPQELAALKEKWERKSLDRWDFGDLEDSVTLEGQQGGPWVLYPALDTTRGDRIDLRLFRDRQKAQRAHRQGVAALLELGFKGEIKYLRRNLALPAEFTQKGRYFGGRGALEEMLFDRVRADLFQRNIRKQGEYEAYVENIHAKGLHSAGQKRHRALILVIDAYHATRTTLYDLESVHGANPRLMELLAALRNRLIRLVPQNFVALYSVHRLGHLVRYLKAIGLRAQRGCLDLEKDRSRADEIGLYTAKLDRLLDELTPHSSAEKRRMIEEYFWMIEEYTVSLFAQELKTAFPVSKKRLEKKLAQIKRTV